MTRFKHKSTHNKIQWCNSHKIHIDLSMILYISIRSNFGAISSFYYFCTITAAILLVLLDFAIRACTMEGVLSTYMAKTKKELTFKFHYHWKTLKEELRFESLKKHFQVKPFNYNKNQRTIIIFFNKNLFLSTSYL